jgi:signal transduction histidine kinase/ligand-binding sensor domain-containing protein
MRLYFLLCLILSDRICIAQTRIEFSRVGVNEGLSQNSVYAIHQDEQGFLWIGTGDGLNRYDGKDLKIYREKYGDTSAKTLPGRIITTGIIEDKHHWLWFGTDKGLTVFVKKEERFLQPSLINSQIKEWQQDSKPVGVDAQNNIWLIKNSQFIVLDPQRWSFQKIQISALLPNGTINDAVLINDKIYFSTLQGLHVFSISAQRAELLFTLNDALQINFIAANKIAVSAKGLVLILNIKTGEKEELLIKGSNGKLLAAAAAEVLYEYPQHIYYIRTFGEGLQRYNSETGEALFLQHEENNSSSLSNNYITTSFVDRSNNLWIGTEGGGLSRMDLKPKKFKSFPAYNINVKQAANLMVKSIFTINGKILIGTFSQGLYLLDSAGTDFTRRPYSGYSQKSAGLSINFIQRDKSGRVWMNVGNAIGYIDTTTFQFKNFGFLKPLNNQPPNHIWPYSLVEYKTDHFLVGSFYGVHRMQVVNEKIQTYNVPADSIMNGYIQSLQMAPDGSIYVGKIRNGFWRIIPADTGMKVVDKGFLTTGIRHFYFDHKRPVVWMASESGLIAYNSQKKTYKIYDENSGLSNSYIYSILSENDSTLWLSTNKGINRAVVRYNNAGSITGVQFTSYTQVDGLQSNEFNTGAFFKNADGTLFFGGVNGINWFRPSQVTGNHYKTSLAFTHFSVNEKEYSSSTAVNYLSAVTLPYNHNTIHLRFASLEFTNAGANSYSYKLEGFDKDWIYSQTINEARYANLPPGNYLFKAKASNSDGVWTDEPLTMSIIIKPPFWATTWFRILAAVLIIALIGYGIHFYISLRLKNRLKELEKQKAVNEERLRISKDMHDELGTGLTKIALLSEVTRQGLSQTKKQTSLQEISNTSRQLTQKMGEIIWTLNPGNDTLDNLAAYLKEYIYETAESLSVNIKTDFPDNIPQLKVTNMQRQQIFLVTKEALNNAIKHSFADTITFKLNLLEDKIIFSLSDTGQGFKIQPNVSVNGKKNGLSNMAWRMKQVQGEFNIYSNKNEGTSVVYSIPVDN